MKKLLLLWLFSGSLDCFCQDTIKLINGGYLIKKNLYTIEKDSAVIIDPAIRRFVSIPQSDTIRATLIVYYDNGPAILHTKPGFVVRQLNGSELYLDDKKKVIKAPLEVLTYKLKKP